jgi:hypothetical protein
MDYVHVINEMSAAEVRGWFDGDGAVLLYGRRDSEASNELVHGSAYAPVGSPICRSSPSLVLQRRVADPSAVGVRLRKLQAAFSDGGRKGGGMDPAARSAGVVMMAIASEGGDASVEVTTGGRTMLVFETVLKLPLDAWMSGFECRFIPPSRRRPGSRAEEFRRAHICALSVLPAAVLEGFGARASWRPYADLPGDSVPEFEIKLMDAVYKLTEAKLIFSSYAMDLGPGGGKHPPVAELLSGAYADLAAIDGGLHWKTYELMYRRIGIHVARMPGDGSFQRIREEW